MDFDPHSLIGTVVDGRYRLDSIAGEGGYSVVYRATHLAWKRTMAVKVLRGLTNVSAERRATLLDGFHREAVLLAELSERSSAIVQARDVGTLPLPSLPTREAPYIVLEWLEGHTLEEVLAQETQNHVEPRSLPEAMELLRPIAEALALAHEMGIVHRDVKPSNVFVLADGASRTASGLTMGLVKLLDFGIAKVVEGPEGGSRVTAVQSFTPRYGAPEQFDKRLGRTSPRTDVFAFASLMVEVLLGRPLVASDRLAELARVALDETKRPTPASFGLLVSDEVDGVFAKALAVDPEARYADMRAFARAIEEVTRDAPSSVLTFSAGAFSGGMRASVGSIVASSAAPTVEDVNLEATLASANPARFAASRVSEVPRASLDLEKTGPMASKRSRALRAALFGVGVAALVGVGLGIFGAARFLRQKTVQASSSGESSSSIGFGSSGQAGQAAPSASIDAGPACPRGMLLVKGGDFFMGTDDLKAGSEERPAHPVHLSAYCLDVHEVTAGEFKACSDSGKCKRSTPQNAWDGITARQKKLYDPICNLSDVSVRGNHPMNCVDWESAAGFCEEMRGGRLPTEAEWEFAARGSDGRVYPWGDEPPSPGLVNACGLECLAWGRKNPDPDGPLAPMYKSDDGYAHTAPVGSFPRGKTMAGMEDMVGNVWEWVSDFNAPYTKASRVTDPKGPEKGEERGIRGGAWNGGDASWLRPTFRFAANPSMRSHGIGFRCAK